MTVESTYRHMSIGIDARELGRHATAVGAFIHSLREAREMLRFCHCDNYSRGLENGEANWKKYFGADSDRFDTLALFRNCIDLAEDSDLTPEELEHAIGCELDINEPTTPYGCRFVFWAGAAAGIVR